MKYIVFTLVFILAGCATGPFAIKKQDSENEVTESEVITDDYKTTGIESIITNKALASYNEKYLAAADHKAFAQSLTGVWSWKANRTSIEHAKTSALINCQNLNTKHEKQYPCKIINVDGLWVYD